MVMYTVAEIAARLKLSHNTIFALFENEDGVTVVSYPRLLGKPFKDIRIPEFVYLRVLHRLAVK